MVYQSVGLKLDGPKMKKLAKGDKIRLAHNQIGGPHKVVLTTSQVNRLKKAKLSGKGAMIQLSPTQLRHNRLRGRGFFSNLLKSGTKALLDSGIAQKGINSVLDKGTDWLKSKGINTEIVDAGRKMVDKGVNWGLNKLDQKVSPSDLRQSGSGIRDIPIIGPLLGGLFGMGLTKKQALSVIKKAQKARKTKGGSLKTHVNRIVKSELTKKARKVGSKTRRKKTGGSFRPL